VPRIGRYEFEQAATPTSWGPRHRGLDLATHDPVDVYLVPNARYGVFARTRAPQVLRVLDLLEDAEGWWLVTEHVAGQPLEDVAPARAQVVLAEVLRGLLQLHAVGLAHGNLDRRTVIDGGARIVLVEMALVADPRDDARAFAQLARSLAPDDRALAAAVLPLFSDDPPPLDRVVLPLLADGVEPEPRAPFAGDDATEAGLLAGLRAAPGDLALRTVYSDWLLERGDVARARFVRGGMELAGTPMWRAVISAHPVERCAKFGPGCPKRWVELEPTDDDRMRTCDECGKPVYYCTTVEERTARELRDDAFVVDVIEASAYGRR